MDSFSGKLAVVTGGGSGMGRELVRQLAAQGCSVGACDVNADTVAETATLARAGAPPGVVVTSHACDVSDEAQVLRFRDEVLAGHASEHVDLVFSNAGIGGGGSFVNDPREDWEHTFAVDWWGVYYCARAFLPLLIASGDGVLVNTSSVNGFWATLGPGPAEHGLQHGQVRREGLHRGTDRGPAQQCAPGPGGRGDARAHRHRHRCAACAPRPAAGREQLTEDQQTTLAELIRRGVLPEGASAGELRQLLEKMNSDFRNRAPLDAAGAATIILDGVRSGAWRILVGQDAEGLDGFVRAKPEAAYDYALLASMAADAADRAG